MSPSAPSAEAHRDRTRARAWALQVLYRAEASETGDLERALADTLATRVVAEARRPYLRRVIEALADHRGEVDAALGDALDNWRMERLSRIDRAILRLAAAEMLYLADVPRRVSIQEAVRLAQRYGGTDSPGFVNGVLDALYHALGDG